MGLDITSFSRRLSNVLVAGRYRFRWFRLSLFRLRKPNKRNFNDIVLNMISEQ